MNPVRSFVCAWKTLSLIATALFVLCLHAGAVPVAYHGKTSAEHQQYFETLPQQGYRMISLSVYGNQTDPRYAAVWVQRSGPAWVAFHGLQQQNYQAYYDYWTSHGYQPAIVTATGSGPTAIFAGVYEQTTENRLAKHDMSLSTFNSVCSQAQKSGYLLKWAAVYGTSATPVFAGIWVPNRDTVGWNQSFDVYNWDEVATAYRRGWARPELVVPSSDLHYLSIWMDNSLGQYDYAVGLTSSQYQAKYNAESQNGYYPIRVQGGGDPADIRYAAIFAKSDMPAQRQWSVSGQPAPSLSAFDSYVKTLMQYYGIRSGQLAVARNGKLLLAHGYTWAEPGYPLTDVTSTFRIASMSKPITSIAIHQLFETGDLHLNDYVRPIVGLDPAPGQSYDTRINDIRIWHLLSHAGGWSVSSFMQNGVTYAGLGFDPMFNDVAVAKYWSPGWFSNPTLPVSKPQITGYMGEQTLQFAPGANSLYSNFGFSLLGQAIEAKKPGWTYTDWVVNHVFGPIGVTRATLGHSFIQQQGSTEVRYYPRIPSVAPTVLATDQHFEPKAYGGFNLENLDSHGGWVMAAADYARLLTAFDLGDKNPLFKTPAATTQTMWTAPLPAINAATLRGWFSYNLAAQNGSLPAVQHNGGLPGTSTLGFRRSDGLSIVLFFNQDIPAGVDPFGVMQGTGLHVETHGVALNGIANAISSWPAVDLFPTVGIPAFN